MDSILRSIGVQGIRLHVESESLKGIFPIVCDGVLYSKLPSGGHVYERLATGDAFLISTVG